MVAQSASAGFWDDASKAEQHLRAAAAVKSWVTAYDALRSEADDIALMPDFVREQAMTDEELDTAFAKFITDIEALEMRNMLRTDDDRLGAIMDINSGAGGTESLD